LTRGRRLTLRLRWRRRLRKAADHLEQSHYLRCRPLATFRCWNAAVSPKVDENRKTRRVDKIPNTLITYEHVVAHYSRKATLGADRAFAASSTSRFVGARPSASAIAMAPSTTSSPVLLRLLLADKLTTADIERSR
jgi:hypothetical protein